MVYCTKANIEYIISHQNNSLLAVIVEKIHLYYSQFYTYNQILEISNASKIFSQVEIRSIYHRNVIITMELQ